ncbi:MAG: hypothetical protein Q7J31_12285 [Syntrophales bacterium]|nr:hypothetical protein [Syntrophales bacterium]
MEAKGEIRKQYKKPQITKVKLEIEEAILAGCKVTAAGQGSGTKNCTNNPKCRTTLGS